MGPFLQAEDNVQSLIRLRPEEIAGCSVCARHTDAVDEAGQAKKGLCEAHGTPPRLTQYSIEYDRDQGTPRTQCHPSAVIGRVAEGLAGEGPYDDDAGNPIVLRRPMALDHWQRRPR